MRVLVTGAAGFLGRALTSVLAEDGNELRLFDIAVPAGAQGGEWMSGDITDFAAAKRACVGMDAIVMSHMAPNRPGVYAVPTLPFDINAKGTAYLFAAAAEAGVKRVILISSCAAVAGDFRSGKYASRDLPLTPSGLKTSYGFYSLTKAIQEVIAENFHRDLGLPVAVLRPASIIDEDTLVDKYGGKKEAASWHFVDPRDIAYAAAAALKVPDLGYEIFYLFGPAEADKHSDIAYTRTRLGWKPKHDFSKWPMEKPGPVK